MNNDFISQVRKFIRRNPYLFALLLLIIAVAVNRALQPNLFETRVINSNLRVWLPLMLLTAGQAVVIIGAGLDLSVGAMVSMGNAILVTQINDESTPVQIAGVVAIVLLVGVVAGLFNGLMTASLGLQPIITTYATSFIYGGIALFILPQPGGSIPGEIPSAYRNATPLGIPLSLFIIAAVLLIWSLLRARRYGRYLYAVGGKADSAYASGVPVTRIRISSYMLSGLMAMLAAITLTLITGAGDPRIGDAMTLDSIVAVVLGGNFLSGGQGSIAGPIIGVAILGFIRNIISFANVDSWSRTLVDALIIVFALAGPGLVTLVRRRRQNAEAR
jgi:ribose transport system permease protein